MLATVANALGKGLIAGFAGTVAVTTAEEIEMKIRGRPPSTIPADIGAKVLRVDVGDDAKTHFATIVHWTYGTLSGLDRALLAQLGMRGSRAAVTHFVLVWTGDMMVLVGLGIAPPPWKWEATELGIHTFHRLVLALTTSGVYEALA